MFGKSSKSYEYEYDENDENAIGGSYLPPQKLTWKDNLIALAIGLVATLVSYLLSYKGLHPNAWGDIAVATGSRPASTITPGYWRIIASVIYKMFGLDSGTACLVVLGKFVLGAIVALGYLTFKQILSIIVRTNESNRHWSEFLSRAICAVVSLVFLCADPVWTLGYTFNSTELTVFIFALSIFLLARFLCAGSIRTVYWAMFVIGLLCAESPIGIVWLFGFWMLFYVLLTKGGLFHIQLLQPLMQQSSKWFLTFFWGLGLFIGVTVNIIGFSSFDGLVANSLTPADIPLAFVSELWHTFFNAASGGGWIVGIGLSLLPFVLGLALLRRATDLEYFLSYHVGIVFFVIGCIAYSQMASLQPLWFWTFSDAIQVNSGLLLYLCSLMCAVAVLCALAVSAIDAFCRDHMRLAAQYDPELDENASDQNGSKSVSRHVVFALVAVVIVAGVVPGRIQPRTEAMLKLVNDYVDEVVTEAGDAKFLFTDGSYDWAYELESARRGGDLKCISLQATPQSRTGWALRSLMPDDEDKLSSEVGGANILRTWQRDKPERLAVCAMQLGLELWKNRAGRDYPPVSGVLARTKWPDDPEHRDAARRDGIARGYALAERVLDIYSKGGPTPVAGRLVNDLFLFLQWRLARLARVRAEVADRMGETSVALDEIRIAETLDDKNESLKRILAGMARLRQHTMRQMTPREGLHFALVRADFALARRYAETVLDADPDDPDANFGMGMDYLMQEQYNRAEEYLTRCLKKRQKEPAIWNNIAVLQYRQGRLMDAKRNALKALELVPDSAEVKDTLQKIEAALANPDSVTNKPPDSASSSSGEKKE